MSSANPVSICSNALLRLGGKAIASFEEPSTPAGQCANLWPTVRNKLLRAHPWNCATKRVILAPMAEAPAFDFQYQFQLPSDWLRTLQVGKKDCPIPFRQEGRRILANVTQLPLVYIWLNDNPGTWDDALVDVAELKMMAVLAYPVTASTTLRDTCFQEAAMAEKMAKAVDGQDEPPEELGGSELLEARMGWRW